MCCSNCKKDRIIINSHFNLCSICNSDRLKSSKSIKLDKVSNCIDKGSKSLREAKSTVKHKSRASLFTPSILKNIDSKNNRTLDEEFYLECFKLSEHICEECGVPLPTIFRDEEGRVNARWRYSHIIPKSIAPEIRHNVENINHLCISCHGEWENGDKIKMKIFAKNLKVFPSYLSRLITK